MLRKEDGKEMQKLLEDLNVEFWQFQFGMPMGNLNKNEVVDPSQVESIIDFAHNLLENSTIKPFLTDCLGYYYIPLLASVNSSLVNVSLWLKTV